MWEFCGFESVLARSPRNSAGLEMMSPKANNACCTFSRHLLQLSCAAITASRHPRRFAGALFRAGRVLNFPDSPRQGCDKPAFALCSIVQHSWRRSCRSWITFFQPKTQSIAARRRTVLTQSLRNCVCVCALALGAAVEVTWEFSSKQITKNGSD